MNALLVPYVSHTSDGAPELDVDRLRAEVSFELALELGRADQEFYWAYFLGRLTHPGQLRYLNGAEATINCLACSNRYGKTTLLAGRHFHKNTYKVGGEPNYVTDDGVFDVRKFKRLRYKTAHAAGEWEQAKDVWDDAHRLIDENPPLAVLIKDRPKSLPPDINFFNGANWRFRTLGVGSSALDGKSLYYISIDEAGWIDSLESMLQNVLRVRVADVRGIIDIVGTFKPGVSRDFYKTAVRASAYTGAGIAFDHRGSDDGDSMPGENTSLDASIRKYAADMGFDLDAERAKLEEAAA